MDKTEPIWLAALLLYFAIGVAIAIVYIKHIALTTTKEQRSNREFENKVRLKAFLIMDFWPLVVILYFLAKPHDEQKLE